MKKGKQLWYIVFLDRLQKDSPFYYCFVSMVLFVCSKLVKYISIITILHIFIHVTMTSVSHLTCADALWVWCHSHITITWLSQMHYGSSFTYSCYHGICRSHGYHRCIMGQVVLFIYFGLWSSYEPYIFVVGISSATFNIFLLFL